MKFNSVRYLTVEHFLFVYLSRRIEETILNQLKVAYETMANTFRGISGFLVSSSSSSTREMENVHRIMAVSVSEVLEAAVRFSNTGGLYYKDLGAAEQIIII